jgi:hypothetical protein
VLLNQTADPQALLLGIEQQVQGLVDTSQLSSQCAVPIITKLTGVQAILAQRLPIQAAIGELNAVCNQINGLAKVTGTSPVGLQHSNTPKFLDPATAAELCAQIDDIVQLLLAM